MYPLVLAVHSAVRWVVLGTGVSAVLRPMIAWRTGRPWTPSDGRTARRFATALDVQVTLGFLLYGALSPVTRAVFAGGSATLAHPGEGRFFAIVHLTCMLAALVFAHVGAVVAGRQSAAQPATDTATANAPTPAMAAGSPTEGRASDQRARHRRVAGWTVLSVAAVAAGVPWWRPLYRAFL